jgi:hypothetical protein
MPATATAIRPFSFDVPEADLDELRRRLAAVRWPSPELVDDPATCAAGPTTSQSPLLPRPR